MKFEVGQLVKYKASKQKMVVVSIIQYSQLGDWIKCKYQNPVTGLFEVQEFRSYELV